LGYGAARRRHQAPADPAAIALYSRIESCCVEIISELEQADLERKKQIAKLYANPALID